MANILDLKPSRDAVAVEGDSDNDVDNNAGSDDDASEAGTVTASLAGSSFLPAEAAHGAHAITNSTPSNGAGMTNATFEDDENQVSRHSSDLRNEHIYEDLCYLSLDLPSKSSSSQPQPLVASSEPAVSVSSSSQPATISGPTSATSITSNAAVNKVSEFPEPKCKRDHCMLELLSTERNYLEALNMIWREFVRPLSATTIPSHPNDSASEWSKIFLNLDKLVALHVQFYNDLHRACRNAFDLPATQSVPNGSAENDQNCVGSRIYVCFANTRMRFTEYAAFCRFLPAAQEKLEYLCQHDDVVKSRVFECQQKANNGRFMLRDLLSVPFQRVTKYTLMLKELAKHFQHDGYASDARWLRLADDLMLDVNFYINEVKRDQELLDSYEKITANIRLEMPGTTRLSDYGRMHLDGELRMRTHGQNNTLLRHIFVFDRVMLICKTRRRPPGVSGGKISFHEALVMAEYRIEAIDASLSSSTNVTNAGAGGDSVARFGNKQWTFSWNLVKLDLSCVYTLIAKTDDQRREWMLAITTAIDNARPLAAASSRIDHRYEFHSFFEPTACTACGKLLRGLFWQGYKCSRTAIAHCSASVHKECIAASSGTCNGSTNRPTATMMRHLSNESAAAGITAATNGAGSDAEALATMLRTTLQRAHAVQAALATQTASRRSLGTTRAARAYNPPSNSVDRLAFEEGDIIEILNIPDAQSIWGRNTRTGEQGFCSMAYLARIQGNANNTANNNFGSAMMRRSISSVIAAAAATSPNNVNQSPSARALEAGSPSASPHKPLEEYSWFVGDLDRETASVWLNQCPNSTFLVRISNRHNERNYAISLKFGDDVRHMLIHQTLDGVFFYLTPTTYFKRIQDLIDYYGRKSLNIAFPGLETRLQYPYKKVVVRASFSQPQHSQPTVASTPEPTAVVIGYAVARYKFDATSPKMISLAEGERVEIISKQGQNRGWWKGRVNDKVGYFPLSYVQQIEDIDGNFDGEQQDRTLILSESRGNSAAGLAGLSLNQRNLPVKMIKSTSSTAEGQSEV